MISLGAKKPDRTAEQGFQPLAPPGTDMVLSMADTGLSLSIPDGPHSQTPSPWHLPQKMFSVVSVSAWYFPANRSLPQVHPPAQPKTRSCALAHEKAGKVSVCLPPSRESDSQVMTREVFKSSSETGRCDQHPSTQLVNARP